MSPLLPLLADFVRSRALRCRPANSTVDVVFVLHLNQNFVPYLDFVAMGFYGRLISALRRHPTLPFNLHLSGTALSGLLWFNPAIVEMIRKGVEEGQFELLFSTYSQAIPTAISEDEFRLQVDMHRRLLAETFGGKAPTAFWNPERIWTPGLFDLLADERVERSLLEDRVIEENLGRDRVFDPLPLERDNRRILFLPDSNRFRGALNDYLLNGRLFRIESLVRSLARRERPACLVYAEDAETFGLWEFERGREERIDPIFARLGRLLDWLAAQDYLRVRRMSDLPLGGAPVAPAAIARRQPVWIERALAVADERYHESGYKDWFDYNDRSVNLKRHRERHVKVLREIREHLEIRSRLADTTATRSLGRLVDLSRMLYVHHQYEFGCPGLSNGEDVYLNRILTALVPIRLLGDLKKKEWYTVLEDVDRDGTDEVIVIHPDCMMVLTRGGHLKYLFNVRRGMELTGGHVPVWLTERGTCLNDESRDLRFRDPLWPWIADRDLGGLGTKTYRLRRVKFVEALATRDGQPAEPVAYGFNDRDSAVYLALFTAERDGIEVRKEFDCAKDTVHVRYRLANLGSSARRLAFTVDLALAPDYLTVILKGRRCLNFYTTAGTLEPGAKVRFPQDGIGVMNAAAGVGVYIRFNREQPAAIEPYEALHALGLTLRYAFDLPAGEEVAFSINATVEDL